MPFGFSPLAMAEDIRDSIFETSLSIIENGNYISFNFYGDVIPALMFGLICHG